MLEVDRCIGAPWTIGDDAISGVLWPLTGDEAWACDTCGNRCCACGGMLPGMLVGMGLFCAACCPPAWAWFFICA
jgi:hypothetical protein